MESTGGHRMKLSKGSKVSKGIKVAILVSVVSATGIFLAGLTGCGPKAFVRGEYDDVQRENLLDDQWSETDMQKVVRALVAKMLAHEAIVTKPKPPIVMVTRLQNKTSEHIDTQNITDMVQVELLNSKKVRFVDKAARDDISEEYDYHQSGMVTKDQRKGPGGQIGADFIINGRLESLIKDIGSRKTVYYKITLNLTDLKTTEIAWSGYEEIRKRYKKQSVGL